jgi:hypothetical protein
MACGLLLIGHQTHPMEDNSMFTRNDLTVADMQFQETYASKTRTNDTIRQNLAAVMEDFSLSDEIIGNPEDTYRVH